MEDKIFDKLFEEANASLDIRYIRKVINTISGFRDHEYGFRLAGGDAERKVVNYLLDEFAKYDLDDISIDKVPVDKWLFKDAYLKVIGEDYIFRGVTLAGVPPYEVEGELIYVDKGTSIDYRDKDTRNKIVLIEYDGNLFRTTLPLVMEARYRGVAGIVLCDINRTLETKNDILFTADGEWFKNNPPILIISRHQYDQIKKEIEEYSHVYLKIDTEVSPGYGYNVIGIKKGSREDNIIISAHHDAHFKGTIDNASGVAILLSLMKALASKNLDKTIVFISFTAEEYGKTDTVYDYLIGSHHYFKENRDILSKNWLFTNYDVIGLNGGGIGILFTPELTSYIITLTGELSKYLDTGFKLIPHPSLWLDQWPAVYEGLSAVAFSEYGNKEYFNIYYHTQYDNINLLDMEKFREYYISSYILLKTIDEYRVPPYNFAPTARMILSSLRNSNGFLKENTFNQLTQILEDISCNSIKMMNFIYKFSLEHKNYKDSIKKISKALLLTRNIINKSIYVINPLEVAPVHPMVFTEYWSSLIDMALEKRYPDWIKHFSPDTIKRIIEANQDDKYWAKGKVGKIKFIVEHDGLKMDLSKLKEEMNLEYISRLEKLKIARDILSIIKDYTYRV